MAWASLFRSSGLTQGHARHRPGNPQRAPALSLYSVSANYIPQTSKYLAFLKSGCGETNAEYGSSSQVLPPSNRRLVVRSTTLIAARQQSRRYGSSVLRKLVSFLRCQMRFFTASDGGHVQVTSSSASWRRVLPPREWWPRPRLACALAPCGWSAAAPRTRGRCSRCSSAAG